MNSPIPEPTLALIKEALARGEKIQAIKLHREATGSGLVEAKAEVEKLERDLNSTGSSAPSPESLSLQIQEALFGGHKIEAIKLHRQATNSGLADAKNAIEKLEAQLRASSPEKFTAANKGCFTLIAMIFASLGAAAAWVCA